MLGAGAPGYPPGLVRVLLLVDQDDGRADVHEREQHADVGGGVARLEDDAVARGDPVLADHIGDADRVQLEVGQGLHRVERVDLRGHSVVARFPPRGQTSQSAITTEIEREPPADRAGHVPHLRRVWKRRRGEGTLIRTPKVPSLATPASCRPRPEFRRGPGPPGTLRRSRIAGAGATLPRPPAQRGERRPYGCVRRSLTTVTAASDGATVEVATLTSFAGPFRLPEFLRRSPSCPASVICRAEPHLGISFRMPGTDRPRRPRTAPGLPRSATRGGGRVGRSADFCCSGEHAGESGVSG